MNTSEKSNVDIVVYDPMGSQYINKNTAIENRAVILGLSPVKTASGPYLLILDQGQGGIRQV